MNRRDEYKEWTGNVHWSEREGERERARKKWEGQVGGIRNGKGMNRWGAYREWVDEESRVGS